MKGLTILVLLYFVTSANAQSDFKESFDTVKQRKMLLGESRNISVLRTDTSFKWFPKNYSEYHPDKNLEARLSKHKDEVSFLVFAATWCGDTKRELPRFYKLLDEAETDESKVKVYFLDRTKKSTDGMTEKYKIKSVPTIIMFLNGEEKSRFVESSKKPIENVLLHRLK